MFSPEVSTLAQLVEPLAGIIPGECEVVVHDLSRLPCTIVAIAGNLTGREVGGPATDMLLRAVARGEARTMLGYTSRTPDGRELRSSTMVVRDTTGAAVGALCINADVSAWRTVSKLVEAMLPGAGGGGVLEAPPQEEYPHDVDSLAQSLLARAVADAEVPVELMQKRHKMGVVQDLRGRGFFQLKEAVETAANALSVTRFTIYNYLNELGPEDSEG